MSAKVFRLKMCTILYAHACAVFGKERKKKKERKEEKESDNLEDLAVGLRVILKRVLQKNDRLVWTGCIWLKVMDK
jgi:hypothetical protein